MWLILPFRCHSWPSDGVSSHSPVPHMGSPVPRHWYLMEQLLQMPWMQKRGACPVPISSQVLVAPGPWRRPLRSVRVTSPRGRRQSWLGMFYMAVAAHPGESVVWGSPGKLAGACGHAGDRKESREDLGHHLVASLTACPKSLPHRVIIWHGQGLKEHQVFPRDSPPGTRDPCPWPRLAHL